MNYGNLLTIDKTGIEVIGRIKIGINAIKYGLIGVLAASIDLGLFYVAYYGLEFSALISHSISVPASAVFSFVCNAWLNFKKTDKLIPRFIGFSIVIILGYFLGVVIIAAVESWTAFDGGIGKVISVPIVVLFQYFVNSRVVFKG